MINSRLPVLAATLNSGTHQEAAGDQDHSDRDRRLHQRLGEPERHVAAAGKNFRAEQHRRDHEILEQQHGDGDLPERRCRATLIFQELHDHGGRGHRQAQTEDDRRVCIRAENREHKSEHHRRHQKLQAPDPGHVTAQRP